MGAALMGQGCATDPARVADPRDPLEPYNRAVYRFNTEIDKAILRPVAVAYQKITPEPVDRGITNFFDNIADVTSVANNILQFKMSRAGSDVGRIFINTTVGVLGFIDVATNVGLPSYKEDFGQTLGYWGLESGAYFVLPLLGPSSIRDTLGWAGDIVTDPLFSLREDRVHWGLVGLRVVDERADLLTAVDIVEDASIDPYSFVRDAYLQRRLSRVYDGNPPAEEGRDDFWSEVDFGNGPAPGGARP
nr:VacJ family lipoprotein [Thiocystis violacea]